MNDILIFLNLLIFNQMFILLLAISRIKFFALASIQRLGSNIYLKVVCDFLLFFPSFLTQIKVHMHFRSRWLVLFLGFFICLEVGT